MPTSDPARCFGQFQSFHDRAKAVGLLMRGWSDQRIAKRFSVPPVAVDDLRHEASLRIVTIVARLIEHHHFALATSRITYVARVAKKINEAASTLQWHRDQAAIGDDHRIDPLSDDWPQSRAERRYLHKCDEYREWLAAGKPTEKTKKPGNKKAGKRAPAN